jgi:hypothetical protein
MNRTNKEIKENYEFFTELLSQEKIVLQNTILLDHKRNNAFWKVGGSNVQHVSIENEILLLIEQSKREKKYGIKLRCSSFTAEPFFRFDSDGPAHRNDFPEIPLEDQLVLTPHFNTFKENGRAFAYKGETLNSEKEAKAIVDDINLGIALFCMESNCKSSSDDFPSISYVQPELDFKSQKDTNFDQISFD